MRTIRITGGPTTGPHFRLVDAESGEQIRNVRRCVIVAEPNSMLVAHVELVGIEVDCTVLGSDCIETRSTYWSRCKWHVARLVKRAADAISPPPVA